MKLKVEAILDKEFTPMMLVYKEFTEAAKAAGVKSVAVTGEKESKLSSLADLCIRLPETETFKIQELTLPVYHCLAAMVEDKFFEN